MPQNTAPLPAVDVAYADPTEAGLPVAVGVPFAEGVAADLSNLHVRDAQGQLRPAAGRTLDTWTDGSPRRVLVNFGARHVGRHEISLDPPQGDFEPAPTLDLQQTDDRITLDDGHTRIELSAAGPGPITRLASGGHEFLKSAADLRFVVDKADSTHEPHRTLTILEHNPLRARVRIEGGHYTKKGDRKLSYRLDVEMWAGWPTVRLDYQFLNLEPGAEHTSIDRIALDFDIHLEGDAQRHFQQKNYGLFYVTRHVLNPADVAIVADESRGGTHVEDPKMLLDEVDYPFYLNPPLVDAPAWLGVTAGGRSVYATMQDMGDMRPARIASSGNTLSVEPWPSGAGTFDLPQGWSRRHVITLAFPDASQVDQRDVTSYDERAKSAGKGAPRLLGALVHEEQATVDPDYLAAVGVAMQDAVLPFARHRRLERTMRGLMQLDFPQTKFDLGDTIDSGYSSTYPSVGKVPRLPDAPEVPRRWPTRRPTQTFIDLNEPVWTNNEYDAIWAFCCETMRTGRQDLLNVVRLLARHNIEVDFLHYSDHKWLHRATPAHSARHTTTGAYPSHFWTQGLIHVYRMMGDVDALEVAVALGDKIIENFNDPEISGKLTGFNREIGWPVLSRPHLMDVTREERFEKQATEMVDYLLAYDRKSFSGAVNLSSGNDRQSLMRQILGGFFAYASMVEGVDHYQRVTGREDVNQWLIEFCDELADVAMEAMNEGDGGHNQLGVGLAVGYERTGDEKYLDVADLWYDQIFWNRDIATRPQVKPVATTHRGLIRMLGHSQACAGRLDRLEFPSLRKNQ